MVPLIGGPREASFPENRVGVPTGAAQSRARRALLADEERQSGGAQTTEPLGLYLQRISGPLFPQSGI